MTVVHHHGKRPQVGEAEPRRQAVDEIGAGANAVQCIQRPANALARETEGTALVAEHVAPSAGAVLLAFRAGGLEVTESMRTQLLDSASEDRS